MLRRVNNLIIALGYLMVLYSFIIKVDIWSLLNMVVPYSMLAIGVCKVGDEKKLVPITFFNIWITVYNIIYLIEKCTQGIDLFAVSWHTFAQYFIPFIVIKMFFWKYSNGLSDSVPETTK